MKQYANNIGKSASIDVDGMQVRVKVLDFKIVFGTVKYLVQPLTGTGTAWKNADSVKFIK